jgi:putative Mg2+ transporter-C (MgtC) family protein
MPSLPGYEPIASVGLIDAAVRLLVASILGAVLGYNRERIGKPAGLRTHMMDTLGAAFFDLIGVELMMEYTTRIPGAQLDPTRVLQGVVGGIGFLGAGSIIHSRGSVEGVTTAASVWVAGAIGAGCGLGFYTLGLLVTGFALFTLYLVGLLEKRLSLNDETKGAASKGRGNRNES